MITLIINAKLQPMHRHDIEDFIGEYLEKHNLGEVDGGGTYLADNGEVRNCDITIICADEKADKVIGFLNAIPLPKGSKIVFDEENNTEIHVGNLDGLGFYFSNDLDDEVYESCDINVAIEKFDELLEGKYSLFSYCETNAFTAIYYYGRSFAEMEEAISDFVTTYPLCENGKIVEFTAGDDDGGKDAPKTDNTEKNELYLAIEKLYDEDKYTAAISIFESADESLKTTDVKSFIAVGYNNADQYTKAVEMLLPLEGKTSNELKRLYRLAFAYWRLNEAQKCIDTCEKVFKLAKTNPELDINGYALDCRYFHSEAEDALSPTIFKTDLGDFKLNKKFDCFECFITMDGRSVSVSVDVMVDELTWKSYMNIAIAFCKELSDILPKVKEYAADKLLDLANSWCEDDVEITKDVFISRLQLTTITFFEGDDYTLYFNNEEMFADHAVAIDGNVNSGFSSADIR